MESYNLHNLTIVIPFRLDVPQRVRNLKYIIKYLKNNFNVRIIIGEIDQRPKLRKYFGCDYIFVKTSKTYFQKTKILNILIKLSNTKFVCSYDVDVLIDHRDIIKAYELLEFGKINFAFPYNRQIRMIRGKYTKKIFSIIDRKENPDFSNLISDDYIFHTYGASGGCFIFNKQEFIKCGMENEHFEGWGYEDDERYNRLIKLDHVIYCMDYPAYHLYHKRDDTIQKISAEQSQKNKILLFDTVINKNKEELLSDIQKWEWCDNLPNIKTSKNIASIKIAFFSIYSDSNTTLQIINKYSSENNFQFKNLKLVKDTEDYDFIVTNYGFINLEEDLAKKKGIIIQSEPRWYRELAFPKEFIDPIEGVNCYKLFSIEKYHTLDFHWYGFDSNYTTIKNRYLDLSNKGYDKITAIVSNKLCDIEGLNYLKRIQFLSYLNKLDHCAIYGRMLPEFKDKESTSLLTNLSNYKGMCESKEEALLNSDYNFDAENCYEENYFTEKAFGGILCDSVTFYDGCPNLEKFIDPRCFIRIKLNNLEESFEIVTKAIRDKENMKRLGYINTFKQIFVKRFNPLRILKEFIEDRYAP